MTPEQIALVQESFTRIDPIKDSVATCFYEDLFATSPELKPLFARTDMRSQGNKLIVTLAIIVNGLYHMDKILPVMRSLARIHVDYGAKAEDYAKLGASLLRALKQNLGDAFTPEVEDAWRQAYALIARHMIDVAYPSDGPLQAARADQA